MKATLFLFFTSFLFCSSSFGQKILAEVVINNDPSRNYFSRSEHNTIKVVGTGCERFELRGVGVALVERSGDYYVQIKTTGNEASINIYGISNGKRMLLGSYKLPIYD